MATVGVIKWLFGGTEAAINCTQREDCFDDHAVFLPMRTPIN
jgi:hypothetical protein